jgi:cytidylate kinase
MLTVAGSIDDFSLEDIQKVIDREQQNHQDFSKQRNVDFEDIRVRNCSVYIKGWTQHFVTKSFRH